MLQEIAESTDLIEQWIKWEPIKGLAQEYYIESISDNFNGFIVILSQHHSEIDKIHIFFANSVDSYKRTNDNFIRKMLLSLHERYETAFYSKWTFFKVMHSQYLKCLSEQSYGISDTRPLTHFVIMGLDSKLDIIANYEPQVTLIQES